MINLSPNKLKFIPKSRGIRDYKNKSEDNSINILSEPKTTFLFENKTKDINKKFNESRYKFSK